MKAAKREKPKPYKHDVTVCLNRIRKNAKKDDPEITFVDFECSSIQRFTARPEKFKTGQPIKIYRKTKTGNEKATKSFVPHKFCPFCGKEF